MSKCGRLRWKCRRGMLELDVMLLSFLDRDYDALSEQQKKTFERLLDEQDPVLYSWFLERVVAKDKELAALVDCIRLALQRS